MKKKKWLYITLITLLILPVLFFYNAFNGNPLSKQISKTTLKNYLNSTYPNDQFVIDKPFYNFKDSGYNFNVRRVGDPNQKEYEFTVGGTFGTDLRYDEIYYHNQDRVLINKLEKEASVELTALLRKKVPEILELTPQIEVLKGKYDKNTKWSKEFVAEQPMYIHMFINAKNTSKEEVLQIAKTIQTTLNNNQYVYRDTTINANVKSNETADIDLEDKDSYGYLKYAVSFEPETQLRLKDVEEYNN